MDCIEGMQQLPDKCVGLVVTSPPYFNVSHKYQRRKGYHYSKDVGEPLYTIISASEQIYRILKDEGTYCLNLGFSYGETGCMRPLDIINEIRKRTNFFVNDVLIWVKLNPIPLRNRLTNAFEYIFVLGKKPIQYYNKFNYEKNVITTAVGNSPNASCPVFPIELPLYLIKIFHKDGLIMDCFSGTGTTLRAAKQLNKDFIGFEINKASLDKEEE